MKRTRKPGYDEALEWKDGLTVHCAPRTEGKLQDPMGLDLCVNAKLPGGGRLTVVVPFKNPKEVKTFTDYVTESITAYNAGKR